MQAYKWQIKMPAVQATGNHLNAATALDDVLYHIDLKNEIQALSSEIRYLTSLMESMKKEVDRFVNKIEKINV